MFKDYRTNDELLLIVGEKRSGYPESEVLKAENELKKRTVSEDELFKKKMKTAGLISAFIGGLILPFSLAILVMFLFSWGEFSENSSTDSFLFRYFHIIFLVIGCFQLVLASGLWAGGIAFRKQKDWGRKIIKVVLIALMSYIVIFSTVWIATLLSMVQSILIVIPFLAFGIIWPCILLFLLWLPLRYFSSSRVRQECH